MITQNELKELLNYDPCTGMFTWKRQRQRIRPGQRAGYKHWSGYVYIEVNRKAYALHRLAWLYVYGVWPQHTIDHINRDRSDNRISNLRDVPFHINTQNKSVYRNTSVGCSGVCFHSRMQKYQAQIKVDRKPVYLGTFDNLFDAVAARRSAEIRLQGGSLVPLNV